MYLLTDIQQEERKGLFQRIKEKVVSVFKGISENVKIGLSLIVIGISLIILCCIPKKAFPETIIQYRLIENGKDRGEIRIQEEETETDKLIILCLEDSCSFYSCIDEYCNLSMEEKGFL
jgi:hypothetical protein